MLLKYSVKSLGRRRASTLLTVVSIGATVAVLAGVLALQNGFQAIFAESGRDNIAVFMRPGANAESDSVFTEERADILIKTLGEIEIDDAEQPVAGKEMYLAMRMDRLDGEGETNVPIRGVQPISLELLEGLEFSEGEAFERGTDEVMVGQPLVDRIDGCQIGSTLRLNTTPFRVVGIFDCDGPFRSEIWGDLDRLSAALERPGCNRVLARLRDGTDVVALSERLKENKEVPAKVLMETEYLGNQTTQLSAILYVLGGVLGFVMGLAAIFTGTNTMFAAVTARTREIGILLSLGFRPVRIFFAFLAESIVLALLGGLVGCILVLPLNGIQTGTTNWNTFTEIAFAFQVTPSILLVSVIFSMALGLVAGAYPAWRAARLPPTDALRGA